MRSGRPTYRKMRSACRRQNGRECDVLGQNRLAGQHGDNRRWYLVFQGSPQTTATIKLRHYRRTKCICALEDASVGGLFRFLSQPRCLLLAHLRSGAMSDMSPKCTPEQTPLWLTTCAKTRSLARPLNARNSTRQPAWAAAGRRPYPQVDRGGAFAPVATKPQFLSPARARERIESRHPVAI